MMIKKKKRGVNCLSEDMRRGKEKRDKVARYFFSLVRGTNQVRKRVNAIPKENDLRE